jgi:hypothetical protein
MTPGCSRQSSSGNGGLDRAGELPDRSCALGKFFRSQEHNEAVVGLGQHDRNDAARRRGDFFRLIVAVVGIERDGKTLAAGLPFGSFPRQAVCDVAERAVRSTQAGSDPVGEFATQGPVGVVYADETEDATIGVTARSTRDHRPHRIEIRFRRSFHEASIAERTPEPESACS